MVVNKNVFKISSSEHGQKQGNYEDPADFEEAISETSFGKFNLILILIAFPVTLTVLGETSTLAYVFPVAQCDLHLTIANKGFINASVYAGMMTSILIWGGLTDIFGRKKILMISLFIESVFVILTTISTNFIMLVSTKFFGGFIVIGATTAIKPFLTEFHGKKYRSRVPLIEGFLYTVGLIYLPLLAWAILRQDINFSILGFQFHAWNVFLILCAVPAFVGGLSMIAMPETPKYLMTKGENKKALEIFKKIYHLNTGKSKEEFPIKKLVEEEQNEKKKVFLIAQWKELCTRKYRFHLLLLCVLQLFITMCHCSVQLWLPQWYQSISDYRLNHNNTEGTFCQMIFSSNTQVSMNVTQDCSFNLDNSSVYINSLIVGCCTVCAYIIASTLINLVGKKRLLGCLGLVHSICGCSLYFAHNSTMALILICAVTMCSAVSLDTTISIVIDLFPTTLRASALSMFLLFSRVGAIAGNLIFPYLLQTGCAPTFFTYGGAVFLWTTLTIFLPNTDMKSLV